MTNIRNAVKLYYTIDDFLDTKFEKQKARKHDINTEIDENVKEDINAVKRDQMKEIELVKANALELQIKNDSISDNNSDTNSDNSKGGRQIHKKTKRNIKTGIVNKYKYTKKYRSV